MSDTLNNTSIGECLEALHTTNVKARRRAMRRLVDLANEGADLSASVSTLFHALQDKLPEVRTDVAYVLALLPIEQLEMSRRGEIVLEALEDPKAYVRETLILILRRCAMVNADIPWMESALEKCLGDRQGNVRFWATATMVHQFVVRNETEEIAHWLHHTDAHVRAGAAFELGNVGQGGMNVSKFASTLAEAMGEQHAVVRAQAAGSLSYVIDSGDEYGDLLPYLPDMLVPLFDEDESTRGNTKTLLLKLSTIDTHFADRLRQSVAEPRDGETEEFRAVRDELDA